MLRLPYFNPIRHLIVDPMHCLFLGIAKWIVKRLWIDGGKLSKSDLKLMENRARQIKLPADMGRIPYKISTGDGFSGFTADQWKSFILIYAIPLVGPSGYLRSEHFGQFCKSLLFTYLPDYQH
jgi:hypothetical protein